MDEELTTQAPPSGDASTTPGQRPDPVALVFEACLQTIDSIVEPRSGIYVCGALETGLLFYEAAAGLVSLDGTVREVNQARMSAFATTLRARTGRPVIDPGKLQVDGWLGSDYGDFFLAVLARYAQEMWCLDGWEYSHGATKEFALCAREGIPCRDERGEALPPAAGYRMIEAAARRVRELGFDHRKLLSRLP